MEILGVISLILMAVYLSLNLVFMMFFGGEEFSPLKVSGILVCMAGVIGIWWFVFKVGGF